MTRSSASTIRQRRRRRHAFTLIEVIATIVVLGAVGAGVSVIMTAAVRGYLDGAVGAAIQAESSVVLDRIVRELRAIELDATVTGIAPDIDSTTATSISWTDPANAAHSISLSGTNLMLAVDGGVARVLMRDVTTFDVQCYDDDNVAMTQLLSDAACDGIRRVRITLGATREGVTTTLRTRVYLRCTMARAGT